ncbi:unnamed protein product [Mytilus coruscus]|uniref:Uncharacterized protein n=1 Tax=Mytilus coruscus TaxID=42192 RepID=A0A6J8CQW9_MYTCO|nr:unnamed protein product [Mytilus coruscus]
MQVSGLDKYVAPIMDNRWAPLVAIVDTTNISSHIVRSIEMPLREIINTTIECKINEELETVKQDIATLRIDTEETFSDEIHERKNFTKIVHTVKTDLDEKIGCAPFKYTRVNCKHQRNNGRLGGHESRLDDLNAKVLEQKKRAKVSYCEYVTCDVFTVGDFSFCFASDS